MPSKGDVQAPCCPCMQDRVPGADPRLQHATSCSQNIPCNCALPPSRQVCSVETQVHPRSRGACTGVPHVHEGLELILILAGSARQQTLPAAVFARSERRAGGGKPAGASAHARALAGGLTMGGRQQLHLRVAYERHGKRRRMQDTVRSSTDDLGCEWASTNAPARGLQCVRISQAHGRV